jgi:hypothetical protein
MRPGAAAGLWGHALNRSRMGAGFGRCRPGARQGTCPVLSRRTPTAGKSSGHSPDTSQVQAVPPCLKRRDIGHHVRSGGGRRWRSGRGRCRCWSAGRPGDGVGAVSEVRRVRRRGRSTGRAGWRPSGRRGRREGRRRTGDRDRWLAGVRGPAVPGRADRPAGRRSRRADS